MESKNVTKKDLQAFTYPTDMQLEKSRVRGLYIGNYVFWDSQKQIENVIENYGLNKYELLKFGHIKHKFTNFDLKLEIIKVNVNYKF